MYELKIKTTNGIWYTADLGEDNPAMNYQVNDIAELDNRNSDGSMKVELPITENNAKIFEFSHVFDRDSDFPYRRHDCRLYRDGYEIAGEGSFLLLVKISTHFECQILSGIADFFELLEKTPMEDIELGNVSLFNTDELGEDSWSECHKYAVASFANESLSNVDLTYAYPFVLLKPAVEKMIEQITAEDEEKKGYELITNLEDKDWNNKAVNISSLKAGKQTFDAYQASLKSNGIFVETPKETNVPLTLLTGNSSIISVSSNTATYNIYYKGRVKFKISLNNDSVSGLTMYMKIGNLNYKPISIETSTEEIYDHLPEVADTSTFISFYFTTLYPLTYIGIDISFEPFEEEWDTIPLYGNLSLSKSLGFKTAKDLFKTFLQLFGLTAVVDNKKKKVYCYTMEEVYKNISKAKDWSRKLQAGNNFEFSLSGYEQKNNILLEENKTHDITDVASFEIDNQALTKEKDLFKIALESGKDIRLKLLGEDEFDEEDYEVVSVAHIPLEEWNIETEKVEGDIIVKTGSRKDFKEGKPHIVEISEETKTVKIRVIPPPKANASTEYVYVDLPLATHVPLQSFIDNYYKALTDKMLKKARVIEAEFYLTAEDIQEFRSFGEDGMPRCMIPVYLDYYGAYFYVNKISNFGAAPLTTCELIRL
ncbi:MAG: hypothetical protein LUG18_05570 [Candidatus Azobacteroides sp.]|nr:hypothetical protein [Candidatus Azobacteroides sp.]